MDKGRPSLPGHAVASDTQQDARNSRHVHADSSAPGDVMLSRGATTTLWTGSGGFPQLLDCAIETRSLHRASVVGRGVEGNVRVVLGLRHF